MKTQLQIKNLYAIVAILLALLVAQSLSAQNKLYRINKLTTEVYNKNTLTFEPNYHYELFYSDGNNSDDFGHYIKGFDIYTIGFDTVVAYAYTNSSRNLFMTVYKDYYSNNLVKSATGLDSTQNYQHRYFYSYTANEEMESKTTQFWNPVKLSWESRDRIVFNYSSGNYLMTTIDQRWIEADSKWDNSFRHLYSYDSSGKLENETLEQWYNNKWDTTINSKITTYDYGIDDMLNESHSKKWGNNDEWYSWQKKIYTYNPGNDYYTTIVAQKYDTSSSTWFNENKWEYTFTSFGKIEKETGYEWDGTIWQPLGRSVYEYEEYSPTGLDEFSNDQLKATGFPNPSEDGFNIEFKNPKSAEIELEIFDATGRKISRKDYGRMQKGKVKLSWSAKASGACSGIYFYKLKSGAHFSTGQFIIK